MIMNVIVKADSKRRGKQSTTYVQNKNLEVASYARTL